jgi:hypothetical protein
VKGCSKSPSWNFLVRIRDTASSMRAIGTVPSFTRSVSVDSKSWKFWLHEHVDSALTLVATC